MPPRPIRSALLLATACAFMLAVAGTAMAQQAVSIGQYGDWTLMSDDQNPRTVCFVVSTAKSSEPKALIREPALFYVSAWPKDGVKGEISIRTGYKLKKPSEATLTVSGAGYKMTARDDRLYVDDATRELKLIEALRKAPDAHLYATSERGTSIADTFSLAGLVQALQAMAATCP